jgi:hypothetical protein
VICKHFVFTNTLQVRGPRQSYPLQRCRQRGRQRQDDPRAEGGNTAAAGAAQAGGHRG